MIMNSELRCTWKEATMAYFKVISLNGMKKRAQTFVGIASLQSKMS
jgi:hypothetical protein